METSAPISLRLTSQPIASIKSPTVRAKSPNALPIQTCRKKHADPSLALLLAGQPTFTKALVAMPRQQTFLAHMRQQKLAVGRLQALDHRNVERRVSVLVPQGKRGQGRKDLSTSPSSLAAVLAQSSRRCRAVSRSFFCTSLCSGR
ncbi:uncharacterized protein PgNI_03538 [Pyricularia grisea]|uniref:Uncharacterized protein n=1 Tax=Pyricularia grisea TaxID=148305 RepID=A0A6P8BB26_PYRGI|nr:uncharacterized protein PgNI_03538 [Pyricularia grisea]TLD12902.1 hypothetical protein PgNI_03538 [Pyricularia grisea]